MSLIKGIFTDVAVNNQPPEFARHLKNVLLTEKLGTPINEPGFTVCVPGSDIPYEVNGVYVIDEAILLYSTDNTNSEIGIVENCVYKTILNDTNFTGQKLNFNTNFPIDTQHYINFNGERIIAWIDDINEPRILNIDNHSVQQLNDIRIFPLANSPDITFKVKDSGGSLEAGTHQIVISYANKNGLKTNWLSLGKPMNITDNPLTVNFTEYDGVEPGTITSKAIEISIKNVDTRFELIRIAVVKTINNIVTAQFVKEVPIGNTDFTTIYTGSEGTIQDITLDEILVSSASYKNAKAIGQVNNKLYLANLTVDEEIDLTEVALATKLQWVASMVTSVGNTLNDDSDFSSGGSNKNPNNEVGFWPGEVCAFYLIGEKADGTFTKGFHIPGREEDIKTGVSKPIGERDKDISPEATAGKLTGSPLNYEVNSTVQNITTPNSGLSFIGEFGYWENKNELYPTTSFENITTTIPASARDLANYYVLKLRINSSLAIGNGVPPPTFLELFNSSSNMLIAKDGTGNSFVSKLMQNKTIESDNIHVNFEIENDYENIGNTYILLKYLNQNYTGEFDILTSTPKETTNYIYLDFPTGSKLSDFPKQGDTITLKEFIQGNGSYSVLEVIQEGNELRLDLNNPNDILGNGTITYTYTKVIGDSLWPIGNVRHHRFPTLHKLRSLSAVPGEIGKTVFPKLSVAASNVNIPAELQDKIVGWRITWAKRTPADATVMGQALYQYAGIEDNEYRENPGSVGSGDTAIDKKFSPSTGNLLVGNNVVTGVDGSNFAQRFIHQQVIKFNCPELIIGKPSMGSLYLRNEVKLSATDAFIDNTSIQGPGTLESGIYAQGVQLLGQEERRWHFQNFEKQYITSATHQNSLLREVLDYSYQPANIIDLTSLGLGCDLRTGEESLYLKVKGGQPDYLDPSITNFEIKSDPDGVAPIELGIYYRFPGNNSPETGSTQEDTYLTTLCQRKDNVYSPFTEQQQVLTTGKALSTETTGVFYGGDARVSFTGIKQMAPFVSHATFKDKHNDPTSIGIATLSIRYYGSYSTKNIGLRHLDNSDISTLYFPKVLDFYNGIFDTIPQQKYRTFLYNEDYTLVNEYNSITVHNPDTIPSALFLPHTVVSSTTNKVEERTISWQTFLSADRYVMPRDKGPVINLQGVSNDRLFIHQRDSLFITRSTTTLKGDITDITLGSGDLFSVTPTEVLSTEEGFAGTQHKFSCKLTKAGYVFADAAQGKIFLHNGSQLEEISKNGQRIFWRDAINKDLLDNPFQGQGITITFDEKYNRLLVGVRQGTDKSFTASYSPATQSWVSFHDYYPDFLIETRKKLYSLKNSFPSSQYKGIYEHHTGDYGIYYNVVEDNPTPYPVLIDIVYNPNPYINKIFGAVEWATEVIQAGGVQVKDETIDYITLSTNNKTTGRVELERLVNLSQIHSSNMRNVNEFWRFNALRDIAVSGLPFRLDFYDDFAIIDSNLDYNRPWYRRARFIDRFMIARFEYSNLYNNSFAFLNHNVNLRQSYR